nr:MAG TPA: hypothetical protein [Caudoviricetes sp.]
MCNNKNLFSIYMIQKGVLYEELFYKVVKYFINSL